MVSVHVDTAGFTTALQKYAALTGKSLGAVVKEQAKLLAKRLQDLTYPRTAAQGKKRVAIDIGKVYLQNQWFEDVFGFTKQAVGDRVKALVRARNVAALEKLFLNTQRLRNIHVEGFDASRLERARKNGRVTYKQPFSFPLTEQSRVLSLVKEKQARVGYAKSGWAACYNALGGNVPSWLSRSTGSVDDHTADKNPSVTLSNNVSYFGAINESANIVGRAMEGRAKDMITGARRALERSKSEAGLH